MESAIETVKDGFGELGRGYSGDKNNDGLEGFEGIIGVFLMGSFGSIGDFPFDFGIVEDEDLKVEDMVGGFGGVRLGFFFDSSLLGLVW